MREVNIQVYTDADKKEVADLILHIQNDEFGIPITLASQPDLQDIPGYYQSNSGNFWVAKTGNKIVGTISLLDIGNRQAALRKMFVDKNYRGGEWGVGQQLLNTLVDSAKQAGIRDIFLGTTRQFTRAQRFYEKNGFAAIAKKELPVTFPVMEVDTKFYRLPVNPL